jgi:PEP-CTERM motif
MRAHYFLAVILLTLASVPARADLISTPPNTVVITYQFPAGEEIEGNGGAPDTITIGPSGVTVPEGALDGASIVITGTRITIKNLIPTEFCDTPGQHPCADAFNGFQFAFSSGVDIAGVTVDPVTSADFRPTGSGIKLSSPSDLLVNVSGDAPAVDDILVLDLAFPAETVPEPASIVLLGTVLAGILWWHRPRF